MPTQGFFCQQKGTQTPFQRSGFLLRRLFPLLIFYSSSARMNEVTWEFWGRPCLFKKKHIPGKQSHSNWPICPSRFRICHNQKIESQAAHCFFLLLNAICQELFSFSIVNVSNHYNINFFLFCCPGCFSPNCSSMLFLPSFLKISFF